jgi:hypothetical protein
VVHRFIFVCGLHRSGTSLLFRLLREHPEISGFEKTGVPEDEGQHLQSVFPPGWSLGGPGRFGLARGAHLTEQSHLSTEKNRAILWTQWSRYWDLLKPCLLEKSPPNLVRTRFLQRMFPESFFVILLRHPLPVAFSTRKLVAELGSEAISIDSLIKHWIHCHNLFDHDRSRLRNVITIKYEDLVEDAEDVLKSIHEFVLVAPGHAGIQVKKKLNEGYFAEWSAFCRTEKKAAAAVVSRYGHHVSRFGYGLGIGD